MSVVSVFTNDATKVCNIKAFVDLHSLLVVKDVVLLWELK